MKRIMTIAILMLALIGCGAKQVDINAMTPEERIQYSMSLIEVPKSVEERDEAVYRTLALIKEKKEDNNWDTLRSQSVYEGLYYGKKTPTTYRIDAVKMEDHRNGETTVTNVDTGDKMSGTFSIDDEGGKMWVTCNEHGVIIRGIAHNTAKSIWLAFSTSAEHGTWVEKL